MVEQICVYRPLLINKKLFSRHLVYVITYTKGGYVFGRVGFYCLFVCPQSHFQSNERVCLELLFTRGVPRAKKQSIKCFVPIHVWKYCGSLCDRELACSASDRQGSNFESCVWRIVSSQSSHHSQEALLAQFSLYVHKGGLYFVTR